MKKFFVNPESEIIELIPAEDIMAGILAVSGETTANADYFADPEAFESYNEWRGFNKSGGRF